MVEKGGHPFKGELESMKHAEPGAFSEVQTFKENPDWVVKEISQVLDEEYKSFVILADYLHQKGLSTDSLEEPDMSLKRFTSEVKRHHNLLQNTRTNLRDYIPQTNLVYGVNEHGEEKGFIVMHQIEGEQITNVTQFNPKHSQKFEQFLNASLDFYEENKTINGALPEKSYLPDIVESFPSSGNQNEIHLRNMMFGRTPTDEDEQLYLIDTYPLKVTHGDSDKIFDRIKSAVENLEEKHSFKLTPDTHKRLARYGTKAFEHRFAA